MSELSNLFSFKEGLIQNHDKSNIYFRIHQQLKFHKINFPSGTFYKRLKFERIYNFSNFHRNFQQSSKLHVLLKGVLEKLEVISVSGLPFKV